MIRGSLKSETMTSTATWPAAVRTLQWHLYCRDVEPWRSNVAAYCHRLTRDRDLAEDLLQETMIRGFTTVGQLSKGMDNPKAFLFRVATNLWIDWRRKSERSSLCLHETELEDGADGTFNGQLEEAFQFLADNLPPKELHVFVLRDLY